MEKPDSTQIGAFVKRWTSSGAAERANYTLFLVQLCRDVLNVPEPEPSRDNDAENAYVFERAVTFHHADGSTSVGRIDLYKRGCFVLEAKQGSVQPADTEILDDSHLARVKTKKRKGTAVRGTRQWDHAMVRARSQAENYAKALPADEGWPPFLIVVDVGHTIELYADFSLTGKNYSHFPDRQSFRINLETLADPIVRALLAKIWFDPLALDPSRHAARVTQAIAEQLATLAKSLEKAGHAAKTVAAFLMRCLFTMFAEDVELLPKDSFKKKLRGMKAAPQKFQPMMRSLWATMNTGGFSPVLEEDLIRFNGGLFEDSDALPLDEEQLALLINAADSDWRDVEPAIFGTLLERALDPHERHKLGAHFTPRSYVERLVIPTVIEPLRDDWENVRAATVALANRGESEKAASEISLFHGRLCTTRVLDPACGSGNFLYVAMEHMKRLEGEILDVLASIDNGQNRLEVAGSTVDPHQFLGIEANPRAAAIAELVLWIGYLQWHFRMRGKVMPAQPVLRNFHNIECRDAVLAWDRSEPGLDDNGKPVTRWDEVSFKASTVTGEQIPDETCRVGVLRYVNAHPADWPPADFVVGNPPFIGARQIKSYQSPEYVDALRAAYPSVPETVDYVAYWWKVAATKTVERECRRFGFITTNSITQDYSRPLLDQFIAGESPRLKLVMAVADHPWDDVSDESAARDPNKAAVRVSMTVATLPEAYIGTAKLGRIVKSEDGTEAIQFADVPRINSSLNSDFSKSDLIALRANSSLCFQGVVPAGDGFKLEPSELQKIGIGDLTRRPSAVKRYIIGKDIVQVPQVRYIIDLYPLSLEAATNHFPALVQHLRHSVFHFRQQNKRKAYRDKWWIFAEPRPAMRRALDGLQRYIVTPYTAKHRPFVFVDGDTIPDAMAYAIASDDAYLLGVLSSKVHELWCARAGGTLEDRLRYNSKRTFFPFPLPNCDEAHRQRIRELGERLDRHRKERQSQCPKLTLTGLYNVLEKLHCEHELTLAERAIHQAGLVSMLKDIHDQLDSAVLDAYGWPYNLSDDEILSRLLALNAARADEEEAGVTRWLRPEYQKGMSLADSPIQGEMTGFHLAEVPVPINSEKIAWPSRLPDQVQSVRNALLKATRPLKANELAKTFEGRRVDRVLEVLQTLEALGQVRRVGSDRYAT